MNWNLVKLNKGKCKVPHLGRNNLIHRYTVGSIHWKAALKKRSRAPGGRKVNQEPAMCPCSKGGQQHTGLHEDCHPQIEGGDPSPLLSPGETTAGVLCSVMGSPVQEGDRATGESSGKGNEVA